MIKMSIEEKIQLIEKGTLEVIDTEELKEVLKKEQPIAYTGYEPSGKIHLGHAVTVQKLKTLQKLGFKIKILLADYHAFLNGKGSVEEIAETAQYNMKCFKALGLDETTEFILGSSFQLTEDYASKVYKLATMTTLKRARRSMDQVSRHDDNPKVASVIYPIMQTVDMVALDVDIALGGMEQRKIQMLARENLEKIDEKVPVCIHTPLLHGLDGDAKMSSSKGNFIAVDDSVEEITKKIKKSYCPQGEVEGNPMIEIAETFVYPNQETLLIKRPEKFGEAVAASQGTKPLVENAQIRSSEDLHKFLERYEQNQKEQAAENEKNRKLAIRSFWVSIAATVFGGGSLIVAIIALALQLSK